jgi:hypothetical protein
MEYQTCHEAFAAGQAFSQEYPRTRGGYKLAERLRQLKGCELEVTRIARTVICPSAQHKLRHCTFEDRHLWLHQILKIIAYEFSADIIPSFIALAGDGMSIASIDSHLPHVERECKEVVQELERARLNVKGRIAEEYGRMRDGESAVGDALAHARGMLEKIIDLASYEIKSYIYPPVQEVI